MKLGTQRDIELHDHWRFEKREALNDALTEMQENEDQCCDNPKYRELLRGAQCISCGNYIGNWQ